MQTARAEAFLEACAPVWVSSVVLAETVWVLTAVYRWPRARILAMLRTATNSRDFVFESIEPVRTAVHLYASSKADFPDCLALELARAEGRLPFATLGKITVKLPGAVSP